MRPLPTWTLLLPFGLSFALGIWALPAQPSSVPVHWGPGGQPDRWGSPAEGLFVMPGILLFASLMALGASRTVPPTAPSSHASGLLIKGVVLGMGLLALGSTAAQAFGGDSFRIAIGGLGLLFILSGRALSHSTLGNVAGPQTSPAALRSLRGAWIIAGVVVLLASVFVPQPVWITVILLVALAAVPIFAALRTARSKGTGVR